MFNNNHVQNSPTRTLQNTSSLKNKQIYFVCLIWLLVCCCCCCWYCCCQSSLMNLKLNEWWIKGCTLIFYWRWVTTMRVIFMRTLENLRPRFYNYSMAKRCNNFDNYISKSKHTSIFYSKINSTTGRHCSVHFEWSHFRISSTRSNKIKTTSLNSTREKYWSVASFSYTVTLRFLLSLSLSQSELGS